MKELGCVVIAVIIAMVSMFAIMQFTDWMKQHPQEVLEASDKDGNVVVEVLYDKYNNIIQKTTYNEITGMTFIYTFTYEQQNGYHTCVVSNITILDSNGNIIKE